MRVIFHFQFPIQLLFVTVHSFHVPIHLFSISFNSLRFNVIFCVCRSLGLSLSHLLFLYFSCAHSFYVTHILHDSFIVSEAFIVRKRPAHTCAIAGNFWLLFLQFHFSHSQVPRIHATSIRWIFTKVPIFSFCQWSIYSHMLFYLDEFWDGPSSRQIHSRSDYCCLCLFVCKYQWLNLATILILKSNAYKDIHWNSIFDIVIDYRTP